MASDYIFPASADLNEIARDKLPMLVADRPIFAFFPIRDHDATLVEWEQRDNYSGLQQIRGINGQPAHGAEDWPPPVRRAAWHLR